MGGPKSDLKDSYNIDLRFDPSTGTAGTRGDALEEISKISDGTLDTVVINNPHTERLDVTQQILESLLKKLKPGGRIVVSGQVAKNQETNLTNFMDILSRQPDIVVIQYGSRNDPRLHPGIKQKWDDGELKFNTTDGFPITSGLGSFAIVRRP
jgi:16S rRNA G1207 methylase RsmC